MNKQFISVIYIGQIKPKNKTFSLLLKAESAKVANKDPMSQRNGSFASTKEVWKFISELGISKVVKLISPN